MQLGYQAEAEARGQAQVKGVEYVFGRTAQELRDQRARRGTFYGSPGTLTLPDHAFGDGGLSFVDPVE